MDSFAAPTPYWYPHVGSGTPFPKMLSAWPMYPFTPTKGPWLTLHIDETMRPILSERGIGIPAQQTVVTMVTRQKIEMNWAASWLDETMTLIGVWQRWDVVDYEEIKQQGYSYQSSVATVLRETQRIPRHAYTYWKLAADMLSPVDPASIQASEPMERIMLLGAMGAD